MSSSQRMAANTQASELAPTASLAVVWDFDSAEGRVNATLPYHFRRAPLEEELEAVDRLPTVVTMGDAAGHSEVPR